MTGHIAKVGLRTWCMTMVFLVLSVAGNAQERSVPGNAQSRKIYTVKNGNMYIELSKWLTPASLDSFISQYHLEDLKLKEYLFQGASDSLIKMGWKVMNENANSIIITKPLFGADEWNTAAGRIRMTEKQDEDWDWSSVGFSIVYGYNRFKDASFQINRDSFVVFFLPKFLKATRMMLAGSFNDWNPNALPMTKTDSGWIAMVKLTPGKYWYKFIHDGNWITDPSNKQQQNDGIGNINSVYYKTNTLFKLHGFQHAKEVHLVGSFNDWRRKEIVMTKTADGWELPMYLADGTHTYRFIIDGRWMSDPANVNKLPNEFGEFNSVIQMGNPSMFKLQGFADAKKVVLSGDFNRWRKDELFMNKTATGWEIPYILGPGNYAYTFIVDGKETADPANPLRVTQGNKSRSYLIIDPNYTFRLKAHQNAKKVYLVGDFNDWDPGNLAMRKEGDEWVFTVHLSPGKHLYKFVVDGEWIIDPGNKLWEQNEYNTGNSVIWMDEQKKGKEKEW